MIPKHLRHNTDEDTAVGIAAPMQSSRARRLHLSGQQAHVEYLRSICRGEWGAGCLWRDGFRLDDAIQSPFVTLALAEEQLRASTLPRRVSEPRQCISAAGRIV